MPDVNLDEATKAGRMLVKFLRDRGIFTWPDTAVMELLQSDVVREWVNDIKDVPMEGLIVGWMPIGDRNNEPKRRG